MIKKITFALSSIAIMSFICWTGKQQEKEYTVRGTLQDFQIILSHPDDVAKNIREKTIAKFVGQLNEQIKFDDSVFKQKVIQDSIKNKKN